LTTFFQSFSGTDLAAVLSLGQGDIKQGDVGQGDVGQGDGMQDTDDLCPGMA